MTLNVDLRGIPPQVALLPVPEGWYKVVIRKSNQKTTAKGDGGYLELIHEILEGAMQGRLVYWNLNLNNPSLQAVEIAYKQLSAIGHCIGVFNVQETGQPDNATPMLHNIPYYIWVTIAQGNQGPINNIKACKDINGNDPGRNANPNPGPQGGQPNFAQPQQPGFAAPAPAAPVTAWQSTPAGGSAAPGYPGAQPATPTGPGGQPWQPGTNTPPHAAPAPAQWQAPQQPGAAPAAPPQQPQQPAAPQWNANPNPGAPAPFPPATPTTFQAPPNPGAPGGPAQPWQQNQPSAPSWQR